MSEIRVDTISEKTSASGVTIDGLTIKDGNIIGDVALAGTTPTFTIGDAGAEDAALIFDGNAQDFYIALDDSADDLVIGTGSTVGSNAKMVIENGGNVGISTASPSEKLTIQSGNLNFMGGTNDAQYIKFGDTGDDDIGNIFYYHGNNNMVFTTNASEAMRIDSSGNLGIGTSSPARALHVNCGADNVPVRFQSTDTAVQIEMMDSNGTAIIESRNDFRFTTGGSETMRLDTSGRLAIGTASPSSYDSSADDLVIANTGHSGITIASGTSSSGNIFFADGTSGDTQYRGTIQYNHTNDFMVFGTTGGTERFRISDAGLHIGGTGAANALDDYEEGTYTVAFAAGSGSFGVNTSYDQAAYVKIGRSVHVQGFVQINSESSASGSLTMTLPFATADDIAELGDRWGSKGLLVFGSSANAGSHVLLGISGNGAIVQIHDESGTTVSDTAATEFDGSTDLYFSFHYMTNT